MNFTIGAVISCNLKSRIANQHRWWNKRSWNCLSTNYCFRTAQSQINRQAGRQRANMYPLITLWLFNRWLQTCCLLGRSLAAIKLKRSRLFCDSIDAFGQSECNQKQPSIVVWHALDVFEMGMKNTTIYGTLWRKINRCRKLLARAPLQPNSIHDPALFCHFPSWLCFFIVFALFYFLLLCFFLFAAAN